MSEMNATTDQVAIATLLRARWPRHAAKRVAQAAGAPIASAKDWLSGRRRMAAATLLRIAASDEVFAQKLMEELNARRAARAANQAARGAGIRVPLGSGAGEAVAR